MESLLASAEDGHGHEVVLVVVENGTDETSESIVRAFQSLIPFLFAIEKRKGIPFARNRCLDIALDWAADYIAFVDDDVTVDANWFEAMMVALASSDADVVSGEVRYVSGEREFSKYEQRPSPRRHAETDSVLFKSWLARRLRFDESYAFSGGSDYLFFKQAYALGAVMIVAREAGASESLPSNRQSLRWLVRRHFRYGLVAARVDRQLGSVGTYVRVFLRSSANVCIGLFELIARLFLEPRKWSLGLLRASRGAGGLAFMLGLRFEEYRR